MDRLILVLKMPPPGNVHVEYTYRGATINALFFPRIHIDPFLPPESSGIHPVLPV